VLAGDSAGGNLAAMVAQQLGGEAGIVGQVLIYPAVDPELSSDSAHQFAEGPFLSRTDMEWFYEQYLGSVADHADPLVNLKANLAGSAASRVPAVILTVGHDPLRDEGIAYARDLSRAGGDVTWIHAPELFHGAFSQSGVLPSSARRVREVWSAVQRKFA
jgi:acetyl esterase